ncbi:MAG: hypothetical protein IJE81_07710 [Oscillospiraceae bacterium]|nr:hypothetical protein [Oscillospiraceae bacterium]
MEENKELLELLNKIEASNRKQLMYTRIQCIAAVLAVACFAGIFFLIKDFLPQISAIITEIPGVVEQMEIVLSNLEIVTSELTAVDFEGMVAGVNTLVQTGQLGLEQTVENLNAIDFDTLNQAIQDLGDVVEPLAKFSKLFGK